MRKSDIVEVLNEKVKKCILEQQLIQNNDKIVVGVSGGPDSMCLLEILIHIQQELKSHGIEYTLLVAHVNHSIREESEQEKIYVEDYCNKNQIPFYYLKANVEKVAKDMKESVETAGRKTRYLFFERILEITQANKIAVAHHLDDNVETILLNIIRGCGLKGLIGMEYQFKNVIRPLLSIEKKDIIEYNNQRNLNPCIDMTNYDTVYLRSKVRNKLIPELREEYNINIANNIMRMAHIVKQEEEFLENYTKNIVDKSIIEKDENSLVFDFSIFMKQPIAIKSRCVRGIIKENIQNLEGIENIHIMDILNLFANNIKGKKYIIGNKFMITVIKKNIARIE